LITIELSSTLKTKAHVETSGTVVGTIRPPAKKNAGAVKISYEAAFNYGFGFQEADDLVMITYGHELANLLDYRINPKGKNGKPAERFMVRKGSTHRQISHAIPTQGRRWKIAFEKKWLVDQGVLNA
jgi:hypothetical protein